MVSGKFVPERFVRPVVLHLVKNMRAPVSSPDVPLILGIHGPPGHGKTYQMKAVLANLGVKAFYLSGSQLEDPDAAVPRNAIWAKYRAASAAMQKEGHDLAALIINDIDTGVGAWGQLTQYTVNRQIVFGCLMDLTDDPGRCPLPEAHGSTKPGDETCLRVPIIVTGNDFTTLHRPLIRLGRMTLFEWQMTFEEKVAVVHENIFPELSASDCKYVVKSLEKVYNKTFNTNAPLSLYTTLKANLEDDCIWDSLRQTRLSRLSDLLASTTAPLSPHKVGIRALLGKGSAIVATQKITGHLEGI